MSTDSPPLATQPKPPTNLPVQSTSFIGREREIAEVKRLLGTTRLLTVTGAGGCGKTRLALRVAEDVSNAYPDGAWLVELATLANPGLVAQAVALAVGVQEAPGRALTESLVNYLRGRTLLLILDNCEHVVDAAAELADALLRSCPHLRILATSREPLGGAGEFTWRLPSLTVPPLCAAEQLPLERAARSEAVQLFMARALAAQPDFTATDRNAPALVEICRRLDGIPLAIELAAARVRVLSAEQIAARLDDRFRLLTVGPRTVLPRQQTLRATVDWSYALLSEPERALLRRLSVFAGGWTLEAAEAVAAGEGIHSHAVLDLLAQLVDKSLVIAEEQRSAVRYRLLETIRQYARDRLQEAGEAERTRDCHLAYFLRLAEEAEPRLRGAEERATLEQLEEEHDNLRAALEWSLAPARQDEVALRLSGALAYFWYLRGYQDEGLRWLTRALAAAPGRSAARAKALYGAGWLAHHRRDSATAQALLRESLEISWALDDRRSVAWVLQVLGRVAYFDEDATAARSFGEESLALAEEEGDDWLIAYALHLLGLAAYIAADFETAWAYYARSLAIRRELGYDEGTAILLQLMGLVALRKGDLAQAHTLFRDGLALVQTLMAPWGVSMPLGSFAYIAAASGQPLRAAHLGIAAAALTESCRTPMIPLFEPVLAEALEMARLALGETSYAAAVEEGRAMSLEAAIAEAFAVEVAPAVVTTETMPSARGIRHFAGLTAAEMQVLRLLTTGRTTKEIAAELVVAVSTVDRHLTHLYQKLGVRNRAEAVAVAIQHQLV